MSRQGVTIGTIPYLTICVCPQIVNEQSNFGYMMVKDKMEC